MRMGENSFYSSPCKIYNGLTRSDIMQFKERGRGMRRIRRGRRRDYIRLSGRRGKVYSQRKKNPLGTPSLKSKVMFLFISKFSFVWLLFPLVPNFFCPVWYTGLKKNLGPRAVPPVVRVD
uniref:Uncharacterized protein n=1 Tax=Cacopsylla melanoneura TaxID=428564 RepID=A0A8D8TIY8_9HEMI